MDADGHIVEVNQRDREDVRLQRPTTWSGEDLAELIIPPALREPHRRGLDRYVETGHGRMVGHPLELPAMRADGSEFPVEIAITRPQLGGPPLFTGYMRDITERRRDEQELRDLARRAGGAPARRDRRRGRGRPRSASSRSRPRRSAGCSAPPPRTWSGSRTTARRPSRARWSAPGTQAVPTGTKLALDSPTAAARIRATGRPARVEDFSTHGRDGRRAAAPASASPPRSARRSRCPAGSGAR